jgi:3-deoxy-7-phosphoheptulonate synthase
MIAARTPHSFLGIDPDGKTCIVNTRGNPWGFLMLRGGRSGANYSAPQLQEAEEKLRALGLPPRMVVDCSHANSDKDYRKQAICWNDVVRQRVEGNRSIAGLMLESNLNAGNQKLTSELALLNRGVSITDGCISWEETETLLLDAYQRLARQSGSPTDSVLARMA